MAEKLCELRKKGGGEKGFDETVLWTNSAPTSNFATQTITLSGNMSDYDFIKVKYKSGTSVDRVGEVYTPVSLFSTQSASYYTFPVLGAGTSNYYRSVVYSSDNKILFGECYMMNSTTKANNRDIPTEIVGCKFR